MTSLGYHDNEDTTTLILDKLGHASVEFLLNKPRKILQFTLQGNSLFTTTSAFLLFTQRRAGGPGVCRYARACVPLLLKTDERAISFLLLTMIVPSTEVLNLYFGEEGLRL